jgi:hypothetical protein
LFTIKGDFLLSPGEGFEEEGGSGQVRVGTGIVLYLHSNFPGFLNDLFILLLCDNFVFFDVALLDCGLVEVNLFPLTFFRLFLDEGIALFLEGLLLGLEVDELADLH